MRTRGRFQFAGQVLLTLMALAFAEIAFAGPIFTQTDSFGVVYTLSSDNINHGTAANPTYDLFIVANTSGFSTSHNGVDYTNANAYINDISLLPNAPLIPNASHTAGPDDITNPSLWTNVLGGGSQDPNNPNNKGCVAIEMNFDCAYFSTGGNPVAGPGILMASTMTNSSDKGILEWEFMLHFAGPVDPPLSSRLKVDYFGFANGLTTGPYISIGQGDIANEPPPSPVPEPGSLALLGALALGFGITKKLRQAVRKS